MKNIFLILLLVFSTLSYSQVRFEGTITDVNGNSLTGANVIAIEKQSKILDGFGISNESGYYRLSLKKNTDYEIKVSFIGFTEFVFDLNISESFEKNIKLEEQAEALEEVELVYEMQVKIGRAHV